MLRRIMALGRCLEELLGLDERRCSFCRIPFTPAMSEALSLCASCRSQLPPYTGACCPRCGTPSPAGVAVLCGHCLEDPPPWDSIHFYGLYEGALREALLRLKFGGDLPLAPVLGALLLRACAAVPEVDMATGVPLGKMRLRQRGYNQALELARYVSAGLGIPLRLHCLLRTRELPPQEQLSARERQENQRNSFAARDVDGQRILLIDDIMTTGSTLRHAVRSLRAAGAREIHVAVVARTPARWRSSRKKA